MMKTARLDALMCLLDGEGALDTLHKAFAAAREALIRDLQGDAVAALYDATQAAQALEAAAREAHDRISSMSC